MSITPIFIFSLPRSGSTLLQQMLMTQEGIASVAEPWILLPLLYAEKDNGIMAEYDQRISNSAISDLISNLPEGRKSYDLLVRDFILGLYSSASTENAKYFIDKTPRYYLIADEIFRIFPDAVFIFLFRHPLAVYSSIMKTWCDNRYLRFHSFIQDLNVGPKLLTSAYWKFRKFPRVYKLCYEELVTEPEKTLSPIMADFKIPFERENLFNNFNNRLPKGAMGDKTGRDKYSKIDTSSLSSWKSTFNNKLRVLFAKNYIRLLGSETLERQGYSIQAIRAELDALPPALHGVVRDSIDAALSSCYRRLAGPALKRAILNMFVAKDSQRRFSVCR